MGRTVITNASILTLDENDTFFYPGYLEIRNSQIYSLGPFSHDFQPTTYDDGETTIIDGTDKLVMPGLVDLHFHTSVAKGFCDHLPLWEYLDRVWYPSIRALTPDQAKIAALYSYIQALKTGTMAVNDMYRHLPSLAHAAVQVGIRAVLSNDIALPEHQLDSIEDNVQAFESCNGMGDDRVKVIMGLEWLPLSSPSQLKEIATKMEMLGIGCHIHLCESRTEVADAMKRFGKRPVEIAYEAGI